MQISVGQ